MKHVLLPDDDTRRRVPFYLAMEEWVAANMPADDYVFTWITGPTVVCGRNQDIDSEVNLAYCRAHGIDVVRRRSGGGCIFADRNNIMISFVTLAVQFHDTFAHYTGRVADQLRRMGIDARATGRNDIVVGEGRKISGNAFYHVPGHSIVHGTMLYDTDTVHMTHAITPSRAKLESKGVKSVSSRIVTAHILLPDITFDQFHRGLVDGLADGTVTLTTGQVDEVRDMERRYYADSWLYRSRRLRNRTADGEPGNIGSATMRVDGVGNFAASVTVGADGRLDGVALTGDFFTAGDDPDERLQACLHGVAPEPEAIAEALSRDSYGGDIVPGLTAQQLTGLVVQAARDIDSNRQR